MTSPQGRLPTRLDKFVREATRASLTQARADLDRGRIRILGRSSPRFDGSELVFPDDVVLRDGQALDATSAHVTLVFHKPKSVTSTLRDPHGKRDLTSYMRDMPAGVFPVGRLDRETTGALLFTTDGDLASAVLRPDHQLEKKYWLWLDEVIEKNDARLAHWLEGIQTPSGVLSASRLQLLHRTSDYTELEVFLREGKNRQIRRMCRATDFRLLHLHRKNIGSVDLDGVPPGSHRLLSPSEVAALYEGVGGAAAVRNKQYRALELAADRARQSGARLLRLEQWLLDHPL